MRINDSNDRVGNFLVPKGTPLLLEGETVLSDSDFIVTFHGEELIFAEQIKSRTKKIIEDKDSYITVESEYGEIIIQLDHMLTMQ